MQAYCFPTPELRASIKKPDLDSGILELLEYHFLFIKDFADNQEKVLELSKEHTLLLDRYFYSNYVYLMQDFFEYCMRRELPLKECTEFAIQLDQILNDMYSKLVQPDLVIYLKDYSGNQKGELIQDNYDHIFETEQPRDFERVRALQTYTFEVVESALKKRGLI